MNNKFDELTKSLAQSVTRRAALKKFGVSFAGIALACLGLASKAHAGSFKQCVNKCMGPCVDYYVSQGYNRDAATANCQAQCSFSCLHWP